MVGSLHSHALVVDRESTQRALDGVDFSLERGQICFVLGSNGSGKSTLLRVLAGLDRPRSGQVTLSGTPVRSMHPRARACQIAWLSQGLEAPRGIRVRELVASARYPRLGPFARLGRADRQAIDSALEAVDLVSYADRQVGRLSGGELERALLARAFAQESDVLLLDEPTAALDPVHRLAFLSHLHARVRERSSIAVVATHDLNLAAQGSDVVLLLDRGKVVAMGPPEQVFVPEHLRVLYGETFVVGSRWSEIAQMERPWVLAWDDGRPATERDI